LAAAPLLPPQHVTARRLLQLRARAVGGAARDAQA
jgi:hypothetical protein